MPKDPDNQKSALIRMLTYLLSDKFSVEKRKQVLAQDYNIRMKEVYEGVDDMSGLGAAIREEEKIDTILNFYKLGVDIPTIAKGVKLAEQEVLTIIKQHENQ